MHVSKAIYLLPLVLLFLTWGIETIVASGKFPSLNKPRANRRAITSAAMATS